MKRHGQLWEQVVAWPNLLLAARRARRGKRFEQRVAAFEFDLEKELLCLQQELSDGSYLPGAYRTFVIHEPKRRLISAAPYRDRVVHHALTNVIEPLFDRGFIDDSYACRRGQRNHAAVRRAAEFARRFPFCLKADVRKYFPSIDHQILFARIARKIKDARVLDLVRKILDGSNPQEPVRLWFPDDDLFTLQERRQGLPIGNQTSQLFANVMLDPLDHSIKETLRIEGYLRYCDDMLLFAHEKSRLHEAREQMVEFVAGLRLRLHPDKTVVFPVRTGVPFLGFRIFPTRVWLDKRNVRRMRRRMRGLQRGFASRRLNARDVQRRIVSWAGHASHAHSRVYVQRLLSQYPLRRGRQPKK